MKVGFLVSSVSREAGGLFQSVRGLAKAVASTNADVRVFGIRDEQSAVDLQEWRPLSVQTFRPRLHWWGYSNQLVPAVLESDSMFFPSTVCGNTVQLVRNVGIGRLAGPVHSSSARNVGIMGRENAHWKKRIAAALYENQHLGGATCVCALSEAEARSIRGYGLRNAICVIPNGIDLPELSDSNAKISRTIEKLFSISVDFTRKEHFESDPSLERNL